MLIAPLLLCLPLAAPEPGTRGLVELTSDGEVLLLPRHHKQPFDAWLYSHSSESCDAIEEGMLDMPNYPKRYSNVATAKVLTRTGTAENPVVTYEMTLHLSLAPTLTGTVTRTAPRTIRYTDGVTKAYSQYQLSDVDDGSCLLRYRIVEEAGKSSGWVSVLKSLEESSGDPGNFAAGLSSARGFARPEDRKRVSRTRVGEDTLQMLASKGTAVVIDRRGKKPTYTLRRRVATPFSDVAWAIRNKKAYADASPLVKKASDGGLTASYTLGAFGGRVSFTTVVKDSVDDAGVLTVEETVSGGDLPAGSGSWTWHVRPVEGGADVELVMKNDVVPGSRLWTTLAETDPISRESFALHIAMSFMGDIVGGRALPVPTTTIARETQQN